MTSRLRDSNRRSRPNGHEPRFKESPNARISAQVVEGSTHRSDRLLGLGTKRLDPEGLAVHLDRLFRAAWALCGSREGAEDLVQETVVRVLSRPRFLRGEDELPYLMQALRNTFVSSRRTAARRPRVVRLEEFHGADRRAAARPEEAVIAAEVFPAIARLPESFRSALVAVDVAGLSHREAARALGAPEATITTRLYRARRRVARELDLERFGAGRPDGTGEACAPPAAVAPAASSETTVSINTTTPIRARAGRARMSSEK
jgi:RNA polymerase sigma-70 factor (ECF subfamily)